MSFDADSLLRSLTDLHGERRPSRYLVAWSGGLDSTVLLHALWDGRHRHGTPIVAVHVNHELQTEAAAWEEKCRRFADKLGVAYLSRTVAVPGHSGSLEAAAREARYRALLDLVEEGDSVLSAHHEGDQAETLLLNLMRGSGPAGLAGIGAIQPFGAGLLVRPLLKVSRQEIAAYAGERGLAWTDDPSNSDLRFDRNYLRREIVPRLRDRWPAASASIGRSAELLAEAAELLTELAAIDLKALGDEPRRLAIAGLLRLSPARQRNLLKLAIRRSGLPAAPGTRLHQVVDEMIPAAADAQPVVRWPGGELRRYRDTLYLLPEDEFGIPSTPLTLGPEGRETRLGASLGALQLITGIEGGIDPALIGNGLTIRFRRGGEKIRRKGRDHRQSLKKLLQEAGVVPWMRQRIPLLYADETLVAVADLWIAEEAARPYGFGVRWKDKPPIF